MITLEKRLFAKDRGHEALPPSCPDVSSPNRGLKGRERIKVVSTDLSSPYRRLIQRYVPKARSVADHFHVVRVVHHHFMQTLAATLDDWLEPIVCLWRATRNNGITEGFHRKMKLIQRRAYGFRNFENYRL